MATRQISRDRQRIRREIDVPEVRGMRNLRTPVDTFVQVKPQYSAEVYNDGQGLKDLKQTLGVASAEVKIEEKIWQDKQDKTDKATATRAALLQKIDAGQVLDTVSAEAIHPDKSDIWQASYNEVLGYNHATRWRADTIAKYEENKNEIGSFPEWMAGETQTYLNALGTNPHYIAGATPIIQQASANLTTSHAAYRKKYQQESHKANISEQTVNILNDENLTTEQAVSTAWNIRQTMFRVSGQTAGSSRAEFVKDMLAYAEGKGGAQGISVLTEFLALSDNKKLPRHENKDGRIVKIASGLSLSEDGQVDAAIRRLQDDQIQDIKDEYTVGNITRAKNDRTIQSDWFTARAELSKDGQPYIMNRRQLKAFTEKWEKDNNLTGADYDQAAFLRMVNSEQNNIRTALQAEDKLAQDGTPITPLQKNNRTTSLIMVLAQETEDGKITNESQLRDRIFEKLNSAAFAGVTYSSVWTQVSSTLKGNSIEAKMNVYTESIKQTAAILGHTEFGDRTHASRVFRSSRQRQLQAIRETRMSEGRPDDGTFTYDTVEYSPRDPRSMDALNKAINKNALMSVVETDASVRLVAKGPNHKDNTDWKKGIAEYGGSSKAEIYELLVVNGVVEEPKEDKVPKTVKFENREQAETWLEEQVAKIEGGMNNTMLQKIYKELTEHLPPKVTQTRTEVPTESPPLQKVEDSSNPLNVKTDVESLLDEIDPSLRELSTELGVPSISEDQMSAFMEFLGRIRNKGLFKSENTYKQNHNRRRKTGTKKSNIEVDEEQMKQLFDRFFDLSVPIIGRPAYFDKLFETVSSLTKPGDL
jgi:hypothetical protein